MTEKRGLSSRVGKGTACACERGKKDNSRIPTTLIKATPLIFPILFQGQTRLFLHGGIKTSSYDAGLTQQDLAKFVRQSRVLHVVLAC
jgi:hypothetical protein